MNDKEVGFNEALEEVRGGGGAAVAPQPSRPAPQAGQYYNAGNAPQRPVAPPVAPQPKPQPAPQAARPQPQAVSKPQPPPKPPKPPREKQPSFRERFKDAKSKYTGNIDLWQAFFFACFFAAVVYAGYLGMNIFVLGVQSWGITIDEFFLRLFYVAISIGEIYLIKNFFDILAEQPVVFLIIGFFTLLDVGNIFKGISIWLVGKSFDLAAWTVSFPENSVVTWAARIGLAGLFALAVEPLARYFCKKFFEAIGFN